MSCAHKEWGVTSYFYKFLEQTYMSNTVLEGIDGWLYLSGGSNNLISYYQEKNKFSKEHINAWHKILKKRFLSLKNNGIDYIHLFVPNKLSVYPEFAGIPLGNFTKHPIQAFMDSFDEVNCQYYAHKNCIINPIPLYHEKKKKFLLYWKTDTHWTFWGCYFAYLLICEKIGILPNQDLMNRNYGESDLVLDLGGKIVPQVKERARFYQILKYAKRTYANEIVKYKEKNGMENEITLHVGSQVIFQNNEALCPQKIILFGDSFSEYRPVLLTGLLAETFKEVHYVWSTSIDFDYVWSIMPDIVITEIVERFMPQVPGDNFKLKAYAKDKLSKFRIKQLSD